MPPAGNASTDGPHENPINEFTAGSRRIDLLDFCELPGVGCADFVKSGVDTEEDWKKAEKANALESSDWEATDGSTCSAGGAIYVNCGTCKFCGLGAA